jgi:hypothetical protein
MIWSKLWSWPYQKSPDAYDSTEKLTFEFPQISITGSPATALNLLLPHSNCEEVIMNFLNWKPIGLLVVVFLFGVQLSAEQCVKFAGYYINVTDTAKPHVKLLQDECRSITLVDNAGVSWPIYLDGRATQLPEGISKQFGVGMKDAYYSASLVNSYQIQLKAHTKVSLLTPGSKFQINTEVEYQANVYILDSQNKPSISVVTASLKLLSVDAGSVAQEQTAGFLQGANWVLDMAKHMLDTTLQ